MSGSQFPSPLPLALTAFAVASCCTWPASARDMVSVYSNICYDQKSGGLIGDQILILREFGDTNVVYQRAAGVLKAPEKIKENAAGNLLQFDYQSSDSGPVVDFVGEIADDAIVGRFNGNPDKDVRLARRSNQQMAAPRCK